MSNTPVWEPSVERAATSVISDFIRHVSEQTGRHVGDYGALWRYSVTSLDDFWHNVRTFFGLTIHPEGIDLPTTAGRSTDALTQHSWCDGGYVNYAERALGPIPGRDDTDTAVICTDETGTSQSYSVAELRAQVGAAAEGLRRLGVKAGDTVAAFAPNRFETLVAFLATATVGGVWSCCSPEFGAASVVDRLTQIAPTVLFAVGGYSYGGSHYDVRATVAAVRAALAPATPCVDLGNGADAMLADAVSWHDFAAAGQEPDFTHVAFSSPLWVLYSSGTTGKPKAITHSVGGIILEHLKTLGLHGDLRPGKKFFWYSTTGWMMWNLLVGGLLVGATIVLYDGSPTYPNPGRLFALAEAHRVDYFGVSAAFIDHCRAAGLQPGRTHDLTSMETLGSTGSPLTPEGFDWIQTAVGADIQISSLSGGTDLCTAFVTGAPIVPVWRGEISCRALGAAVAAFDANGTPVTDAVGELVITEPMPSMPIFLWGDHDGAQLHDAYFDVYPGIWRHGDWIRVSSRGSVIIEGRSDATLNRGGIRMGTAEFYRIVDQCSGIVDSMVVDTSGDAATGRLVLFVVINSGTLDDSTRQALVRTIRKQISPRHVPDVVRQVTSIPRTINGKKCEVPVKHILNGRQPHDAIALDALADSGAFATFLAEIDDLIRR